MAPSPAHDGIAASPATPNTRRNSLWQCVNSGVTGKRARRVQQLGGREFELPPRCASFEGYNLHGNTAVAAKDRAGLDKRCRYVLRPPLAALVPPPRVNTALYLRVLAARAND